ncbi:MAG: hypothetical protein GY861_19260, partial [bacterium]|nr:hypothetical protein [bacterium]
RQSNWAKFSQENPDSPLAAPKRYMKLIPTMPGWDILYPSMALDKDQTRIEHCKTLLESLEGKENPKNTAIWRLLTTQSGCNLMNPENVLVEYVKTEDALDWMVKQIRSKGARPPGYQTLTKDASQPPGVTGIIYLGHDQEFWTFDWCICHGTNGIGGYCPYSGMSQKLWDHFCWIPYQKGAHQFCPIIIITTWFGVAYVVNFIYIDMDIAKKENLKPISEEFPSLEALLKAPIRSAGVIMQKYYNLMMNVDFRFVIWAIGNDKKTFEITFGISLAETPDRAVRWDKFPNYWRHVPGIDFQTIAGKTLLAFLAGYLTPKTADFDEQKLKTSHMTKPHENVYPGLEPCALALESLENNPRRLGVILEQHHIKTKAACPGTDEDL